jgi:hypothetical protein
MVRVIELVAFAQGGVAYAVSVRVTLPAAISAALGVYIGCRNVALSNVPVPDVVQSKLV